MPPPLCIAFLLNGVCIVCFSSTWSHAESNVWFSRCSGQPNIRRRGKSNLGHLYCNVLRKSPVRDSQSIPFYTGYFCGWFKTNAEINIRLLVSVLQLYFTKRFLTNWQTKAFWTAVVERKTFCECSRRHYYVKKSWQGAITPPSNIFACGYFLRNCILKVEHFGARNV